MIRINSAAASSAEIDCAEGDAGGGGTIGIGGRGVTAVNCPPNERVGVYALHLLGEVCCGGVAIEIGATAARDCDHGSASTHGSER